MAATENDAKTGARLRSPSYPVIPLDEAIERIATIFQHDKRAFTTNEALLSNLGYRKGGLAGRIISALRQYGLLEEQDSKFRVSESAFHIVSLPEEDPVRIDLIRNAALLPALIQKTVELYEGELPSDATLKSHLIRNENFNPDRVNQFIRVLRRTLEFAKIPSVGFPLGKSEPTHTPLPTRQQQSSPTTYRGVPSASFSPSGSASPSFAPPGETLEYRIADDCKVNLTFSGPVTQQAIEKLIKYLNLGLEDFPSKEDS